ncbi:MAG: nuclear transport factor 2 family protein [Acidobacteria bacterium]|nr:nuclear transport factor 2 family protein [Acidobacteriota bacterium]
MSEQQNRQVIEQAYQNFKTGDIQALLGQLTEDVSWQLAEMNNVPFAGKRQGQAAVGEFFATLADAQDVLKFEPQQFVAQGDKVVALGQYNWRVKATGREYGGDWAHVFTVRDGKIAGFQEYMDTASATDAFK